ncbi:MAG: Rieske 2Fe-2S domain-containing protein [Acidobacteria bacterium]|nr:Rieske 2Fe-2S domain-containing protein [Acidobacteriota bacterium]
MKSFANVKGHPIHPALIPFPFAFLPTALLFDAGSRWLARPAWAITGFHLLQLGILSGLVAAVPGALDFLQRVPPASSGRSRALRHGLLNVAAIAVFAIVWSLRRDDRVTGATLALELLAVAVLLYSGSLGGTLVTRNLISVDHRHANAGRWRETRITAPAGTPVAIARADELERDQMKLVIVNGHRLVLARTGNGYAAFDDGCTHRGGSLADGVCIDGAVQCLWHGSQFDCATGEVRSGPAKKKIRTYEVKQQKDEVLLVSPPR